MKYHCTGCDYIYDEILGDIEEGIEAKTFFDDLPNDFFCPFCDTYKDDFVVFPESINIPSNIDKLTNIEYEHFPIYTIENDKISFEFLENQHPIDKEHFIYKVELYDESGDLIDKLKFNPEQFIKGSFDLEYLDYFELRVYCSRDGIFSTGLIENIIK